MEFRVESWSALEESLSGHGLPLDKTALEELSELKRFLAIYQDFPLPLRITKRERPDFEIIPVQEVQSIGLEHTWAANEAWEQTEQYLLNTKDPECNSVARNWLEGEERRGKSLANYISGKQGDSCIWGAREQAQAKAAEVIHSVRKKSGSFSGDGFQKYPENWLLISDRLPFLFLELSCFREAIIVGIASEELGYTRVFFVTQLADRENCGKVDALFEISSCDCNRIR